MNRKFIVDSMLGRLSRWLRLIGEDTEYFKNRSKGSIVYRSLKEQRIILTKDRKISKKRAMQLKIIEGDDFIDQLKQVISYFSISIDNKKIYTRCTECNNALKSIAKSKIENKVPEYVFDNHEEFSVCDKCYKIYWKGTHNELIKKVLNKL